MQTKPLSDKQLLTLWFVQLRWAAIFFMMLIVLTLFLFNRNHQIFFLSFVVIGFAAGYNITFPALVKRFPAFSENILFTYLRASADILVVTILVHFTGGIESPFTFFYLLEFAAISIYSLETIAFFLSGQAALLYWINCALEAYSIIPHFRMVETPGTLYYNLSYITSKSLALFFSSLLIIYIVSYLARKLREKQHQVETLSVAQADFMHMVMHETKTPLTSILGYTDLLINKSPAENQREPLAVIKRQAKRILNMVNDLLSLARIESGKIKLNKVDSDLRDIAERAIEEVDPLVRTSEISIVKEFESSLPLVQIDEDRLHEVFINLLSNAIKFSNKGGKIFVSISLNGQELTVAVRDEGLGVEKKDLPLIFDKFYRASKESAERKGTGLGLALCRSVVELHGGRIWVASAGPGHGSVFYFALPLHS
ncbi:MAG: HAMP domain-containing sensor histidine kinase [Candidatus Margulisiibacteriota bacterium]